MEPVDQRHAVRELQQSYGGHMSGLHVGIVKRNCYCNLNGLAQCLIKQRVRDGVGLYLQMV